MKFAYYIPHLSSIYAARTIVNGYKNAAIALGNEFQFITANNKDQKKLLDEYEPNIIIINLNKYALRFIDIQALKVQKIRGAKIFASIPLWQSTISKLRINETPNLKNDDEVLRLIRDGLCDIYFNVCEQNDPRMEGFTNVTGQKHYTIQLAADDTIIFPEYYAKFHADISYIGTYLPEKRPFFKEMVFPLKKNYDLRLYGQDWTLIDRSMGWVQRAGQYFNLPLIKSFRKPKLKFEDERRIYTSSKISINVHEEYQRVFGGDCNERTFKIPLAGGFEICDNVSCIRKYFKENEEIIIARDKNDWFEKINYYLKYPERRLPIIEAGRSKVLKHHTYKNRINEIIRIYNSIK